jgi:hypothetical protein
MRSVKMKKAGMTPRREKNVLFVGNALMRSVWSFNF